MTGSELQSDRDFRDLAPSAPKGWIVGIYVAAVLIRVVLAFTFGDHAPQIADARDYDRLAMSIYEEGRYASESGQLISLRPPLFPAMVAICYKLFGALNYVAVSLMQGLVSMLIMLVTHRMGILLGGSRVGLFAAAVVGFYPSLLAFNCLVLSETLFTFFFVAGAMASLRFQSSPSLKWAAVLGLCLGLGALTRSILWVCSVPLLGYLLLTSAGTFKRRFVNAGVAFLVFAIVVAPWAYRNTKLHKTFTVVDVMGGRNVMMGNYEHTPLERSWATVTEVTGDKSWHHVLRQANPDKRGLTQGQIDKLAMRYGVRYFFDHPVLSAKRCAVRFFNFWQLERTILAGVKQGIWGELPKWQLAVLALLVLGSYASLLLFTLIGFFLGVVPWKQHGLLLLWMALPCAVHTIAFAHSRYHLPLVPLMAVYAGITLVCFRMPATEQPSMRRAVWLGALLFGVFVLGWAREVVFVDLAKLGGGM